MGTLRLLGSTNAVNPSHNGNRQIWLKAAGYFQCFVRIRLAVDQDVKGSKGREWHVLRMRKLAHLLEKLDGPIKISQPDVV